MRLPKIQALDLRSLEVQVAEHNARGGLQFRVWDDSLFEAYLKDNLRTSFNLGAGR